MCYPRNHSLIVYVEISNMQQAFSAPTTARKYTASSLYSCPLNFLVLLHKPAIVSQLALLY